jgi:hypothetical protein
MKEVGGDEIYTDEEWAEDENAYKKDALARHISLGVDLQSLLEHRVRAVVDEVSVGCAVQSRCLECFGTVGLWCRC